MDRIGASNISRSIPVLCKSVHSSLGYTTRNIAYSYILTDKMVGKKSAFAAQIRAYIKNRCFLGIGPKEIFHEICSIYGPCELSYASVTRWCKKFASGITSLQDAPCGHRKKTATGPQMVEKVREIVSADARFTVREIARKVGISIGAVHSILRKHLKMNKITARWIPHLLTEEQKRLRVKTAKSLLKMYPKYNNRLFANIVTGDETWVHFYEPKRKHENKIWATKHMKRPCIAKRTMSVRKVMYAIFFTNQGPAIQIAVPKGKSVNSKFYRGVVLKKLKKYFKRRRPATGLSGVRLLHDNASSHKAAIVRDFLRQEKVVELPHPPYSPDLAPCDYFLFPRLKKYLTGRKYKTRKDLGSAIFQCLKGIPRNDYENAFKNWIKRLKMCIAHGGEYFEGIR